MWNPRKSQILHEFKFETSFFVFVFENVFKSTRNCTFIDVCSLFYLWWYFLDLWIFSLYWFKIYLDIHTYKTKFYQNIRRPFEGKVLYGDIRAVTGNSNTVVLSALTIKVKRTPPYVARLRKSSTLIAHQRFGHSKIHLKNTCFILGSHKRIGFLRKGWIYLVTQ